jgi:hypothetical protein
VVVDDRRRFVPHLAGGKQQLEKVPFLRAHGNPSAVPESLVERSPMGLQRIATKPEVCPKRQAIGATAKTHRTVVLESHVGELRTVEQPIGRVPAPGRQNSPAGCDRFRPREGASQRVRPVVVNRHVVIYKQDERSS